MQGDENPFESARVPCLAVHPAKARAASVARNPGGLFEAWRRCARVLGGWLVGVVS